MAIRTSLVAQPHLYMGDSTGKPLDYGMVYFGQPNKDPEFYPIDIYYDEALTIAAMQPVRSKGGFLNANGDMVEVYAVELEYSVKVLDSYGRQVFYKADMTKSSTGASVSTKLPQLGAIIRTQDEKNSDYVSIKDFGLVADGATDDSTKLQFIESAYTSRQVDMLGMDVAVASLPTNNSYYNGRFIVGGKTYSTNKTEDTVVTNRGVFIGNKVAKLPLNHSSSIVAIGEGAISNISGNAQGLTAIGFEALKNAGSGSVYNVAVGGQSQYENKSGTRNVSLGDNSLRFNKDGANNTAIGRNAGQAVLGQGNISVGNLAMAGRGSLKFRNVLDIFNQTPITADYNTAVGYNSMFYGAGNGSVALGAYTLIEAKKEAHSNVAIGISAMRNMGIDGGINGGSLTNYGTVASPRLANYVMTDSSVEITLPSDIIVAVNDYIWVRFESGISLNTQYKDLQIYKVNTKTGNKIVVDEPNGVPTSGTVNIISVEVTQTPLGRTDSNTAIGTGAMQDAKLGNENVAVGYHALKQSGGKSNVAVGTFALTNLSEFVGRFNTGLGYAALRTMQDGSLNTSSDSCVGIGNECKVSGNNQIQLGNSNQATYAYGAVQDRSDARDKIIEGDITDAHIDFFNDVEFKRYRLDYRDDYIVSNDDGTVTKLDKDGSKARKREHVGVIAQQVEEAMRTHNVDFAGLQHHAVNGGNDVYTVGYQEFIPILGEIVQRQQKQIDELKKLIEK